MLWRQKALMSAWCIAFFFSIDDCLSCFLIVIVFLVCRIMSLAQDYCLRRSVFGKLLVDHPLHLQTLARMEVSVFLTRWICKTGKIQGFHSINWVEGKGNTELMVCSSLQAGSPLSDMPKCRTGKWSGLVKSGEQVLRKWLSHPVGLPLDSVLVATLFSLVVLKCDPVCRLMCFSQE